MAVAAAAAASLSVLRPDFEHVFWLLPLNYATKSELSCFDALIDDLP